MRVIYFVTNYPSYSETFIAEEIKQIQSIGHTPIICNFTFKSNDQSKLDHRVINNSRNVFKLIRAILISLMSGNSLLFNASFFTAVVSCAYKKPKFIFKYIFMLLSVDYIVSKVKVEKIDLAVNHFLFKSTLASTFICVQLNLPFYLRLHTKRHLYSEKVLMSVLNSANKISAIARDVGDFYKTKIDKIKEIDIIRQSVDISFLTQVERKPSDNEIFTIIAIGRLIKKKGFSQLVEAFDMLGKPLQNRSCVKIYGDGSCFKSLKTDIVQRGLDSRIQLMGKKEYKPLMSELANADLLVVPSVELEDDIDGMPTVIIEAMILKTTVLAYDTGSISEVVLPYKTGFLVPANDVSQLTEQMSKLILDTTKLHSVIDEAHYQALVKYKHTLANELTLGTD